MKDADDRKQKTQDRRQNRRARESGQYSAGKQDKRKSGCRISEDQGIRIQPKLFDNCRECSTNRPCFFQNKANLPAGQNSGKVSFDKGL